MWMLFRECNFPYYVVIFVCLDKNDDKKLVFSRTLEVSPCVVEGMKWGDIARMLLVWGRQGCMEFHFVKLKKNPSLECLFIRSKALCVRWMNVQRLE